MIRLISFMAVAVALAACGEKDQSLAGSTVGSDNKAYEGVKSPYLEKGWTTGDKVSWEKQMRDRGQHQNEYNKTN